MAKLSAAPEYAIGTTWTLAVIFLTKTKPELLTEWDNFCFGEIMSRQYLTAG